MGALGGVSLTVSSLPSLSSSLVSPPLFASPSLYKPSYKLFRLLSLRAPTSTTSYRRLVSIQARHYLVEKVSAKELNQILTVNRNLPVVVDFFATWCGPCILVAQQLEQLAVEYKNRVKFVKIDTDEEYELANEMQIRGLPTIVFVSKDAEKDALRAEGLFPTSELRNIINSL